MRERRFDHDEAYVLRFRRGVPVATLAKKFGVSESTIYRVTEEGYRRLNRACNARSYAKRTREVRQRRLEEQITRRGLV